MNTPPRNSPEPRSWYACIATWPIDLLWLLWVVFIHGVDAILVVTMAAVADAILWFPAVLLDARLGLPLAEFGVVVVAVAAACGFLLESLRSAKAKWNTCPW